MRKSKIGSMDCARELSRGLARSGLNSLVTASLLSLVWAQYAVAAPKNVDGEWGPVIQWPEIAISAATLPDGRVLTWSSTETNGFPVNREFTNASVFDPTTETFVSANSNFHDMFCAGISTLEDGTIVASGGNPDDDRTSAFDLDTLTWKPLANMNDRRWYGTNVTMPNNQIWSTFAKTSGNRSELYTPETDTWTRTPHASMQTLVNEQNAINASASPQNTSNLEWFGHMALTPEGKVLHGGPTPTWHLFDPVGGEANQSIGQPIGDLARMYGNVVTYDAGKVMLLGGYDKRGQEPVLTSNAILVDLNGAAPVVTRAAPMNYARAFNNTVTMPNGELLVVGGNTSSRVFSDEGTVYPAEIYNPETDTWRVVDSIAVPRNYHSIALLLKDGRVLSAGGGGCGNGCNTNHLDGQIYSPPYLFNADGSDAVRPTLSAVVDSAHAGDTVTVTAGNGVQRFAMVRLSGTTHHVNTDQRYLPVESNDNGDGSFALSLNANPNVLIPGNYWLFAVNANGTPSIGQTINITRKPETEGFTIVGDASVVNPQAGEYRITPAVNAQLGALGSNFEIDFTQSFTIESELYFGDKDGNGADGIALSLHADPRGAQAISALAGPGLGAWGLQNGIALEFDTYQNGGTINDPAQDHFAIWDTDTGVPSVEGNPATAAMTQLLNPVALGNLENGQWHALEVSWNVATATLVVSLDGNVLGSISDDALVATYFAGADKLRATFSGATGGLNNNQQMRGFVLSYLPDGEQPQAPTNVALGKPVTQSSVGYGGVPTRAVDGNNGGQYGQNEITHTANELNAWWEVDLGEVYDLSSVQLWNREDCCIQRLANFQIFVSDVPFVSKDINTTRAQVGVTAISQGPALVRQQSYGLNRSGRYLRIQMAGTGILSLAEVVVMGVPSKFTKTQERIVIDNADFEAQTLNDWGFTRGVIQDWDVTGTRVGVWRPADDRQGNTPNTAYLDRAGSVSQTLSAVLENNTDLSMEFKIGGGGLQADGDSSWAVRLYAGNNVLGEVGNNDFDPNGRARMPAKLELSKDQLQAFSAQFGQPLKIEFTESGDPGFTYFDDVSLVRTRYVSNETDTDGDGVPDGQDAFPGDPNESVDSDGDGVGDNSDAFPNDSSEAVDSDGDGVGDNSDPFPNDPNRDGTIAALPEYPRNSSTLIVEEFNGNERVWNVNPDNNSVSVSNAGGVKLAEIAVGDKPWALTKSTSAERIYVTNKDSASISIISADTLQLLETVVLPERSQPHGIVFDAQGDSYYVVLEALAQVQKRNAASNALEASLNVDGTPRHLAMAYDDSQLLVSNFITPFVDGEDSGTVNINNGFAQVFALDPNSMTLTDTYEIPFDATPMSESRGPGLPNYLAAPAISYDSAIAYVPGKKDNIIAGTLRGNPGMTFDQTVRAHTSSLTLTNGTVNVGLDHDNASVASGAAFSGDSRYLAVTLETSRELLIYDVEAGFELMRLDTGRAPQSVAFSKDSTVAYVHNFTDRSISRFDLTESFRTGLPDTRPLPQIDVVGTEQLAANILKGKQLFYDAADTRLARDSYMSCASCHKEGKHDGRVWDMTQFGEGLRNTTSLLGKGNPAHGMFHWTGNFDEIQDFEAQIRVMAGGTGLMNDADFNSGTRNQPLGDAKAGISADLDALAAYLASLDEQEISPYQETAASQQGLALFTDKGCAGCHSGVLATDSKSEARHDVGTAKLSSGSRLGGLLDGFDTPSLHGLFAGAPYLHDGSAATVQEAILAHNQAALTSQEADAVAAFLLRLNELSLAQPSGPITNVALGKAVAQSSLAYGGLVERAVDGSTTGNWRDGDITHTDLEMNPWLELDLGAVYQLSSIKLWNRTDCCIERLTNFEIYISETPFVSKSPDQTRAQTGVTTIANNELVRVQKTFTADRKGRYVRVQLTGQGVLSLAEIEVMGQTLQ